MKSIELFAGIGGISLAAEWAGIETAAFCEIDPFAQKVLDKHWPDVPIFDDVKKLNKQSLIERGVDVGTIELISGGFPCQPYSIAGKRKGKKDDRDLWPEMFRIIQELKPTWIVGENVANFVNMELERTTFDLENEGYEVQSFLIPACGVNAKHKRYRTFIVAHTDDGYKPEKEKIRTRRDAVRVGSSTLRNADSQSKLQTDSISSTFGSERQARESLTGEYRGETSRTYWQTNKPPVCGVVDGIPEGLDKDRLIALGNAVVPQQIYPIFEAIVNIEKGLS